jgi:hypothetical protein
MGIVTVKTMMSEIMVGSDEKSGIIPYDTLAMPGGDQYGSPKYM